MLYRSPAGPGARATSILDHNRPAWSCLCSGAHFYLSGGFMLHLFPKAMHMQPLGHHSKGCVCLVHQPAPAARRLAK